MAEFLYVLTNEAMPGIVKIGVTNNLEDRLSTLYSTGVPLPFECHYAVQVPDAERHLIENKLHQLFADKRINPRREFFRVEPEKVVIALSIGGFPEVVPVGGVVDEEDRKAIVRERTRRTNLSLASLGIKQGSQLVFSRDESVVAYVVEGNRVALNGETLSLSAAAVKCLQAKGYRSTSASGSEYWTYEGELLDERRQRLELEALSGSE